MTKLYKIKFRIILETEDKDAYHQIKGQQAWIETYISNELVKLIERKQIDYVI